MLILTMPSLAYGEGNTIMMQYGGPNLGGLTTSVIPATDNTYDLGSSSKRWADFHYTVSTGYATTVGSVWVDTLLSITSENITAGAGTGITVNRVGHVNTQLYKVTTTYAAYTDSDATKGIVIATLPAKTKIVGFYSDTTVKYTGGSTDAATMVVGITSESAAEIIASHDVYAAAILVGDADADMGTAMTRAAAIQGGYLPSWTGTTAIYATLAITSDVLSNLTTGSTTFYIETERY